MPPNQLFLLKTNTNNKNVEKPYSEVLNGSCACPCFRLDQWGRQLAPLVWRRGRQGRQARLGRHPDHPLHLLQGLPHGEASRGAAGTRSGTTTTTAAAAGATAAAGRGRGPGGPNGNRARPGGPRGERASHQPADLAGPRLLTAHHGQEQRK